MCIQTILSISNVLLVGAMAFFMYRNNCIIKHIQKENDKQQDKNKKLLEYLIVSNLTPPYSKLSDAIGLDRFKNRLKQLRQGDLEI